MSTVDEMSPLQLEPRLQHRKKTNQTIGLGTHISHVQGHHDNANQRGINLADVVREDVFFEGHLS